MTKFRVSVEPGGEVEVEANSPMEACEKAEWKAARDAQDTCNVFSYFAGKVVTVGE